MHHVSSRPQRLTWRTQGGLSRCVLPRGIRGQPSEARSKNGISSHFCLIEMNESTLGAVTHTHRSQFSYSKSNRSVSLIGLYFLESLCLVAFKAGPRPLMCPLSRGSKAEE